MSSYLEKASEATLPVVVLRDAVAFPSISTSVELSDLGSMAAIDVALEGDRKVFLVTLRKPCEGEPTPDLMCYVGATARIKSALRTPDGNMRLTFIGLSRATVVSYNECDGYISASLICKTLHMDETDVKVEAYMHQVIEQLSSMQQLLPHISSELFTGARAIRNPSMLADYVASGFLMRNEDKQAILEKFNPVERLSLLLKLLEEERELLTCEFEIHSKVQEHINRERRDYYLREQIRVIEDELGEGDNENEEFYNKIMSARLPEEVEEKLLRENDRLSKVPFASAEASVIRTYLETCLDLPWHKTSRERSSVDVAKKILDADHDGLEKVKERILEFIAVRQLSPELKSQIICLVGPPGTGKTSVAESIARATGRKYVRVSLGGVRDEADIRGHRKTYIGAMPGRIMAAMAQVKVRNPLILLDEIDKLTRDAHGDPSSALLEVLDPEQNKTFRDHFIELPFDLSECMFITTANTLDTIPRPLLDRMEVIELHTYTPAEKLSIAKHHLLGKQLSRHGLNRRTVRITDDALTDLIVSYTREAGVRGLERSIASLCRKAAKRIVTEKLTRVVITRDELPRYLGPRKYTDELIDAEDAVGVVNGLAWTEVGGDLLKIEVAILEGTGKIELTGSLGDVMKESAQLAVSYARSVADRYGIPHDFYKTRDIHIHAPEGAVPKDGPSAGITMVTALISALSGRPVRHDVAMTGEVTLLGRVLPIGGLKEKTLAAFNAGVKTVLIPEKNIPDLDELDPTVRDNVEFIPVSHVSQVLDVALTDAPLTLPGSSATRREPSDACRELPPHISSHNTVNGDHYGA